MVKKFSFDFNCEIFLFCLDGHSPNTLEIDFEKSLIHLKLYTPQLQGLTYNDFALAFKIDGLEESLIQNKNEE
jgi:pterin-4a-carbinolamine dehydratase